MTDQHVELTGNAGPILRAAREEQGLSLAEVAEKLHLRGSVVDAMEREDFAQFNSPIFLKGYFRSYCRLMKLHEDRMLALLEKQLGGYYGAMDEARNEQLKVEQKLVHQRMLKKLALFLILLLVPVTLLFYTTSGFDRQQATTPATEEQAQEQSAVTPDAAIATETLAVPEQEFAYSETPATEAPATDAGVDQEPLAEGDISDTATTTPALVPATAAPATTESSMPSVNQVVTPSVKQALNQPAAADKPTALSVAPALAVTASTDEPVTPVAPAADGSKTLNFTFSADCWVKLTDGKGKVRVAELKYGGDTFSISAMAPLQLVLGNARVVSMTVDNQPYDLIQHTTQNGRAALVIQ